MTTPCWAQRVNDNAPPFGSGELTDLSMMYGMPDPTQRGLGVRLKVCKVVGRFPNRHFC